MENIMMNSYSCRPNTPNCRMQECSANACKTDHCSNSMKNRAAEYNHIYGKIDHFPLGMAYVPMQYYDHVFDLSRGLKEGTIFPELCLPFCGKRRKCSC